MKFKILLIAVCFVSLMGSTYSAKAEFIKCYTFHIECEGGGGTNLMACGTYESLINDIVTVQAAICD